jgi:hypothetical protein
MRRRMIGVKVSDWEGSRLSLLNRLRATVLESWSESNRRSIDLRDIRAGMGQIFETFPL